MKMRKFGLFLRMIAMVLTFAFLLSAMPALGLFVKASAAGNAAGVLKTEADAPTLNSWMDAFNPSNISTEHAGGIWTDKSVITADNIANVFGNITGLEAGENNFLVALSALAANSVLVGKSSISTDTVFVLDISGSMSDTDLRSMVSATNDAIHTLLSSNESNRVGVILYSSSASVLLPLDSYKPVTESNGALEYIEYSGSRIRAARVSNGGQGGNGPGQNNQNYTYITNSNNQEVTTSISVGGGTYIQGGLWEALEMFQSAAISGQRAPALVLMSDGAPTFVDPDFSNIDSDAPNGDGNSSEDGEAFLTQLTAAYVKEKISEKYGSDAYLYTLGLGVSSSGNTVSIAEAVLNTDKTRTGLEDYWTEYLALASKTDKTMNVEVHFEGWFSSYTDDVEVTYNPAVSTAEQQKYVNKYFSAANASQLSAAFQSIVGEISLKSGYYVTRLDGASANSGGFISFIDEIGTGMQVKEIEGILIGNHLYTGLQMAKALEDGSFGTAQNPTNLGDNMIWALIQRLDIQSTATMTASEIAHDLLNKAYAAGQLSYVSDTNWSNYIGWFGDANGNYIGFWDVNNPNATIPEGAVYANKCYGMLGATTDSQTAHASDMMYVAVQVSKPVTTVNGVRTILNNSPERVTFSIPASLIPVITYQISVDADDNESIDEDTAATISYNGADPIRLIYEVGIHSELTPENIHSFIRPGYQAKDKDGNYYLYTNAWNWEGADDHDWQDQSTHPKKGDAVLKDTSKNAITYAYFEPGEDNEHYYFTEDSIVYVKDGNSYVPYEGTTQPNGTYYFKHLIYTATADSNDPDKTVAATIVAHFEELSEKALELSRQTSGANTWYVPAGTMHRNMHDHDRGKVTNTTGSFYAIRHQLVDIAVEGDSTHHYELLYMGNNGRVTYAPSQGFSLTKELAEGDTSNERFAFTITITGDTDGKVTVVTGTESKEITLDNGVLELGLYAGETVLVTGLDTGAVYTIQEILQENYKLDAIAAGNTARIDIPSQTARDVVAEHKINAVTYTNAIQYYGNLLVTKEVTYLKGTRPADGTTDSFPVKVTFEGLGGESIYVDGVKTTLGANGDYTFNIVDGKTVQFTGIPAGTVYDVSEVAIPGSLIPEGYTAEDGYTITMGNQSGSIAANHTFSVTLKNQYEPEDVAFDDGEPKITVNVDKTLVGNLAEWSFDFVLQHYNGTAWEDVKVGGETVKVTLDQNNPAKSFDLEGVVLSTVGNHYFRVAEVIPEEQTLGMTYDRTLHDFVVTVVDDLSGKLKIQSVESIQHANVEDPIDGDGDGKAELWIVATDFTNTYSAESTKLTIQANKSLYNITTGEEVKMAMKDGQFQFTLYSADSNFENLVKIEDSRNGIGGQIIFTPIVYQPGNASETVYYYVVKESSQAGNGYTVDNAQYQIAVTVATVNTQGSGVAAQITKVMVQKNDEAAVDVTDAVLAGGNVLNGDTVSFKNTYAAATASVNVTGTKTLTNLTPGAANTNMSFDADVFTFTLADASGELQAVYNTANGTFSFEELVFDTAGVYTYTIREKSSTMAGVTMDTKVYTLVVTVTDDGEGVLHAHVSLDGIAVNGNAVKVAFNNTYKAAPATGIVLEGTKVLQVSEKFDRPLRSGEFRFTLTRPDGTTETVYNDSTGKFTFSAMSFDTVGSYTYTISEVGAGATANGITYASNTLTVTVDVVDDGSGKLVAKVGNEAITNYNAGTFTNTYAAAPVTVELTGRKYLLGGRELLANEFSFTLTKPDGTETVKNDEDGNVIFSAITFDSVGTYTFTVVEDKLDENGQPLTPDANGNYVYKGVTYSQLEYTVTVTVTDNGSGNLVAHVVTEDNNGNLYPIQFFNRYKAAPVDVTLGGEKNLEDSTSLTDKTAEDFEFSFVLTDGNKNILETVTNNGGIFTFETLSFAEPSVNVYYIYELDEGLAGITYDETLYKVTVTVTDNGIGNLEAAVIYEVVDEEPRSAQSVVFTNGYAAKQTSVTFTGMKTFQGGRDLKAGEFSFILKDAAGEEIETVSHDANGVFTFTAINYIQEGEYVYTLEELAGTDDNVTYDGTKYTLTVTVTDVNGQLTAATAVNVDSEPREEYGFLNIFTPDDVSTTVIVEKIVDNKTNEVIGRDGFKFDLYCNETRKTVTVTSGVDGLANFELTFTGEDVGKTYTYKLTEQKGDMPYMSYSKKVYNVSITVGQDKETGELMLTVTRDGKAMTENAKFVNVYAVPMSPETGDNSHVELFAIMMGISVVCLLAVLVLNKKFLR